MPEKTNNPKATVTIRQWWKPAVAATIVVAFGTWIIALQAPETYEASASVLVGPMADKTDAVKTSEALLHTDTEIIRSESALHEAAVTLGLSPDQISNIKVHTNTNETTHLLVIKITDTRPEVAADLANEFTRVLAKEAYLRTAGPEGKITTLDTAVLPEAPVNRHIPRHVFLYALTTLAACFGVGRVIDLLTKKENARV